MRILVTGATGFAGSMLLPRLLRDDHELRALARDPSRLHLPAGSERDIEVVRGDVLSGAGLTHALRAVEVAYYLIHSMESPRAGVGTTASPPNASPGSGASLPNESPGSDTSPPNASPGPGTSPPNASPGSDTSLSNPDSSLSNASFPERERLSAENFAAEARRAGVRRIVYLGGLLPAGDDASRHLASRGAVERILLGAVEDSVALRASIVIGARSRSFRFLVRLVERMPVLALPSWHRFRTRPVDARDVTELLARAASTPPANGLSLDVAGTEELSYGEIIERITELMLVGRPTVRFKASVTALTARVAAAIAGEDPELILPLMEGLQGDLLPSPDRVDASRLLGVKPHSFAAAVEHALREWETVESLRAR